MVPKFILSASRSLHLKLSGRSKMISNVEKSTEKNSDNFLATPRGEGGGKGQDPRPSIVSTSLNSETSSTLRWQFTRPQANCEWRKGLAKCQKFSAESSMDTKIFNGWKVPGGGSKGRRMERSEISL